MFFKTLTVAAVFTLCVFAVSCSDHDPIDDDNDNGGNGGLSECTGAVALTVRPQYSPVVTWLPECKLWYVLVESEDGEDVWYVAGEANTISPPVNYGSMPAGGEEMDDPAQLISGESYRVSVFRYDGSEDGVLLGAAQFTY